MKSKIAGSIFLLLAATIFASDTNSPAIIPQPQKLELRAGAFKLAPDTKIFASPGSIETANQLAATLRRSTGYPLKVSTRLFSGKAVPGGILLTTRSASTNLGTEGYELTVAPNAIVIRAPTQAGLFYGAQTLVQLLPPDILSTQRVANANWQMPCIQIEDWPRFQWRGLMLDVSRHFFTRLEVEQLLDAMALLKLNTFHWHLTDDQGWRIEIKQYPKLTQIGAWRPGVGFDLDPKSTTAYGPDGRYGGFYTQDDIREVVAFAAARHITIVPEIEMPGHSSAALAAYSQFSCTGGPFTPQLTGGVFHGIYCTGNEETYVFLQNVLAEVFRLFPGQYIHIGGDEVPTDEWRHCPKDQSVIQREGLKNESGLESYFIRRMEKFINAHGRTLVGWSEIRQGGLAQNAVVMDWIGGAVEAASAGHDVVMTPMADCYLDHYQSKDHATEPRALGGFLPLDQVYSFEPIPANLAPQYQRHILGAQGNLWTEYIPSLSHAEYMVFPRECALAEVTWSAKSSRDWNDFTRRLQRQYERFDQLGINYRHNTSNPSEINPAK
ncbi:MAG: beta-N-acetylhexosaminidase [Limisphaerales bacterium]